MTKASNNEFPSVLFAEQVSTPSTPATGFWRLYTKSDGLYLVDDAGTATGPFVTSSGAVATDAIWDTAGDLAQATGANAAAKLAAPVIGKVLTGQGVGTALAYAYPPGYEYDYAAITAGTNITATTEATANTVVTGNAVTYDGSTAVIVEFYSPTARPDSTAATRVLGIWLYDGASSIGEIGRSADPAASGDNKPTLCRVRITPSAASHTYSIRATVNAGTGNIGAGAGGAGNLYPAYIRITKA